MSVRERNVLETITGNHVTKHDSSLKRPRDDTESIPPPPFHINAGHTSRESNLAIPHLLIDRTSFPLSFLELSASKSSRFIRADSQSLREAFGANNLLIISLGDNGCLHVLEPAQPNIYAICKLASQVEIHHLKELSATHSLRAAKISRTSYPSNAWWSSAEIDTSEKNQDGTEPTFATQALLPRSTDLPVDAPAQNLEESTSNTMAETAQAYLDALYLSKASLAYFAKGPLSRARAAFDLRNDSSAESLAERLTSMLLSSSTFDKKYRDRVPAMVQKIASPNQADAKARRTSKSKSYKLSKTGLYGAEEEFLSQWWIARDVEAPSLGLDEHIKSSLALLRRRESLLQLILILEILALGNDRNNNQSPSKSAEPPKGKTKPKDLRSTMDMLIDRLCIWQSISIESKTLDAEQPSTQTTLPINKDELKDFCTAVVIPFYSSRLPRETRSICRKFGVARVHSPSKIAHAEADRQKKAIVRPGTEVGRNHVRNKSVRPETRGGPSLLRSVTDSALQEIKRERSETPLDMDLLRKGREPLSRTGSMSRSIREVDMTAIAKFNEARSRNKTNVDQELKDAIATLKKPNRSMAVKEYVDAADSRRPASRQRPAIRRTMSQVQIGATPKKPTKFSSNVEDIPMETPQKPVFVPSAVPSSQIRPSTAVPSSRLLETPSRGHQRFTYPALENERLAQPSIETPGGRPNSESATDTPVDSIEQNRLQPLVKHDHVASVTPSKARAGGSTEQNAGANRADSIYQTLGWDDNEIDDFL